MVDTEKRKIAQNK
jgi:hypothetical protein